MILTTGIRNPSSTCKVPGIRNPPRGIQNPTVLESLPWGEQKVPLVLIRFPLSGKFLHPSSTVQKREIAHLLLKTKLQITYDCYYVAVLKIIH